MKPAHSDMKNGFKKIQKSDFDFEKCPLKKFINRGNWNFFTIFHLERPVSLLKILKKTSVNSGACCSCSIPEALACEWEKNSR